MDRVTILFKDERIGIMHAESVDFGDGPSHLLCTTDSRDGIAYSLPQTDVLSLEDAYKRSIGKSVMNGWRVGYEGAVNIG